MLTEEQYLFTQLGEECAEVQQRISKLLRFGRDEIQEEYTESNIQRLQYEIYDMLAVLDLLETRKHLTPKRQERVDHIGRKIDKILRYMAYSQEIGILEKKELL